MHRYDNQIPSGGLYTSKATLPSQNDPLQPLPILLEVSESLCRETRMFEVSQGISIGSPKQGRPGVTMFPMSRSGPFGGYYSQGG